MDKMKQHLFSIYLVSALVHLFFSVCTRTTYVPDEYHQGVEQAYNIVYDTKSVGTWEWRPKYQIRSYVLILPYILFFHVGKLLDVDNAMFVSMGPRIIQGLMAAVGDLYLFRLSAALGGDIFALYTLTVHLCSWSVCYMMSRTLANSTETVLLVIGLYYWLTDLRPLKPSQSDMFKNVSSVYTKWPQVSYMIAAVSSYSRVTSAAFWGPLLLRELLTEFVAIYTDDQKLSRAGVPKLFMAVSVLLSFIFSLSLGIIACLAVDCLFYGCLTFTPINFVVTNIVQDAASRFGVSPWHWYLTQGLPVMLAFYFPLLLASVYKGYPKILNRVLSGAVMLILTLSLCPHKELRFILPILPLLHMTVAWYIQLLDGLVITGSFRSPKDLYTSELHKAFDLFDLNLDGNVTSSELGVFFRKLDLPSSSDVELKEMICEFDVDGNGSISFDEFAAMMAKRTSPEEKGGLKKDRLGVGTILLGFIGMMHLTAAIYLSSAHQAGPEAAMKFIVGTITRGKSPFTIVEAQVVVHLLAPCHAFPGSSFVHIRGQSVSLNSPDCSPSSGGETESAWFERDPVGFYIEKITFDSITNSTEWTKAQYVVTFDAYVHPMKDMLLNPQTFDDCKSHENTCHSPDTKPSNTQSTHGIYRLAVTFHHADFQYDYDDPSPKKTVYVFEHIYPQSYL